MAGDLLSLLMERVLVSDGATGTMLYLAGVPLGRPLPELNFSHPALVRSIHGAYAAAGSDIIQTNTFGANRDALARHGLAHRVNEVNVAGARIAAEARDVAGRRVLIAGPIGPLPGDRTARTSPGDVFASRSRRWSTAEWRCSCSRPSAIWMSSWRPSPPRERYVNADHCADELRRRRADIGGRSTRGRRP